MPDYFSHYVIADKTFERLDNTSKSKINDRSLYLLGAQGGDVFFAYNISITKNNLGRAFHRLRAAEFFEKLCQGNLTYAAGFATHYALDCTLHPAVYAYELSHKSVFAHQRMESDLGLYISKLFRTRRCILPRERVLSCTGPIYDSIKLVQPDVTVTGVERCLKRHFNYTKYLYKNKKQNYVCDFDFSSLAGAVEDAIDLGVEAIKCVLSRDIQGAIFEKDFLEH